MRWRTLCSIAGVMLLLLGSGPAEGKNFNHLLRGDYAFSGEATCLVSTAGFNTTNLTPLGQSFVFSFSVQGVRTFNADGTGHVTARVVRITHPSPIFPGSASSTDFEADFTYEVAPDLTFTVETSILTGTILTGLFKNQTITIANFPKFSGRISQDHRTLTLAHDEPTIETQTRFVGNVLQSTEQRICHRSRILLELKGVK